MIAMRIQILNGDEAGFPWKPLWANNGIRNQEMKQLIGAT